MEVAYLHSTLVILQSEGCFDYTSTALSTFHSGYITIHETGSRQSHIRKDLHSTLVILQLSMSSGKYKDVEDLHSTLVILQ